MSHSQDVVKPAAALSSDGQHSESQTPQFTSGPWHTPGNISGYTDSHVFGRTHKDGSDFAPLFQARTKADANLIAAAPEMYEALKVATNHATPKTRVFWRQSEDGESSELAQEDMWPEWYVNAQLAIAKAEGRAA